MKFVGRDEYISVRPFTKATVPSETEISNKKILENLSFKSLPETKNDELSNQLRKEFHIKKVPIQHNRCDILPRPKGLP
jgi:hypothetical protein